MKKTIASVALAALLAAPAFAADSYTIDPTHTFPSFEISHFGFSTYRGRFDKSAGTITLDRAAKSGSVEVTIDTPSVSTGMPKLDDHLRSEDFFDAAKHSKITFKSTKFNFNGDVLASVDGQLSMHGVTKPVTLAITNFKCGPNPVVKKDACGVDANVTIKRSEFGITKYVPNVGDDVKILIQIEAHKN